MMFAFDDFGFNHGLIPTNSNCPVGLNPRESKRRVLDISLGDKALSVSPASVSLIDLVPSEESKLIASTFEKTLKASFVLSGEYSEFAMYKTQDGIYKAYICCKPNYDKRENSLSILNSGLNWAFLNTDAKVIYGVVLKSTKPMVKACENSPFVYVSESELSPFIFAIATFATFCKSTGIDNVKRLIPLEFRYKLDGPKLLPTKQTSL